MVGVAVDLAEATETNGSKPPSPQHFPFIEKEAGDTSLTYTHKQISYLMTVELAVLHASARAQAMVTKKEPETLHG